MSSTKEIIKNFDLKPHQIRYRLENPKKYGFFRTKKIDDGVSFLVACPAGKGKKKCKTSMQTQSIRFDKKSFDVKSAAKWIKDHGY